MMYWNVDSSIIKKIRYFAVYSKLLKTNAMFAREIDLCNLEIGRGINKILDPTFDRLRLKGKI